MKLPALINNGCLTSTTEIFSGYDRNIRSADGTFCEMQNLSSENYPVLTVRKSTKEKSNPLHLEIVDILGKDHFMFLERSAGVCNMRVEDYEDIVFLTLDTTFPKQIVTMGAYVIVFPDGKYRNLVKFIDDPDDTDYGYLGINKDILLTGLGHQTIFILRDVNGNTLYHPLEQSTEPDPDDLHDWLDTSVYPAVLKEVATSWKYVPKESTVEIQASGLTFEEFSVGDTVYLNATYTTNSSEFFDIIAPILNKKLEIKKIQGDTIYVTGSINALTTYGHAYDLSSLKLSRAVPIMDHVISSNNRLWGCRYGTNRLGKQVNEIYASKLGDFKNWESFGGTAADSYAVSVASEGPFTGAINYLGYPMFFKENHVHRVYGSYPAEYQVQTSTFNGVKNGSNKSLQVLDDMLFYLSADGIMAYTGGTPTNISEAFGGDTFENAIGCAWKGRYYFNATNLRKRERETYYYDIKIGSWFRRQSENIDAYAVIGNELFELMDGVVYSVDHKDGDEIVEWSAVTNDTYYFSDRKYLNRVNLRISLEKNTMAELRIQYDSSENWALLGSWIGSKFTDIAIPVRPRRCDHFRLKLSGRGPCKIYGLTKVFEKGSDVSWR